MATYTYSSAVAKQQADLNKQGAGLKVDGLLGPLTKAAISKYSTPTTTTKSSSGSTSNISGNALIPSVNAGSIAPKPAGDYQQSPGFIGPIRPVVQTSGGATKDLANIKTNVTDINTNIQNQTAKLAADKALADAKAAQEAATKTAAEQKKEELRIKNAALTDTGTEPTKTPEQLALDKANAAYEKATADYETEAENVRKTILRIQNGSVPLSAGEQAQIAGLEQGFQQLIDTQRLQNTAAGGLENIRGYQTGAAEYDPTFQNKVIGGIVTAGLNKIADLNIKMASAVAEMTQGFKDDKIDAIKDAWTVYNNAVTKRQDVITKTIDDANAKIKDIQDKKIAADKVQYDTVTKPVQELATIARQYGAPQELVDAMLAATTYEQALSLAGKYLTDPKAKYDLEHARLQNELTRKQIEVLGEKAVKAPEVKTINGVDYLWNEKTGKYEIFGADSPANTQKSVDQLTFLRDTAAKALQVADRSGSDTFWEWGKEKMFGVTQFQNLQSYTNTLKTNVLALMTDPTIKKFFGPQMSNADVLLMTSSGTTLNPTLNSPQDMKDELYRLDDLFNRMLTSVKNKGGTADGYQITSPTGEQVIITD